ncbi:MAG TPA: HAMP domain-containing sensor histidine kinase, partial [Ramlibacter sp.]|nr:HAMP domain-containing sensor histidine kinase [Ramlibacter sp.]
SRHRTEEAAGNDGIAKFTEEHPGELLAALERAERRALYCQGLVSTFVQSARDAYPGSPPQSVSAQVLVEGLLDEFPFEENERASVTSEVASNFHLPGRRDLLYLVLCTLAKNALQAMRGQREAQLRIVVGAEPGDHGRPWIRFADNGPGIPPAVLAKLTREPVTTKSGAGGSGMGLMFCQRVMQSVGGTIGVESAPGEGTTVTLYFRAPANAMS